MVRGLAGSTSNRRLHYETLVARREYFCAYYGGVLEESPRSIHAESAGHDPSGGCAREFDCVSARYPEQPGTSAPESGAEYELAHDAAAGSHDPKR